MKRHKNISFVFLLFLLFNIAKIKSQNTPRDDGPALLVKPDSSTVPANTRVSFFCRADGNPIPTIVWRKNGEPINDGRYSTRTLTNGLSTLRIEPVLSSDNDLTISCTADNGVGSPIKAEAKLKVLVEASLPPGFPEIEAHPVLKSVEQGRTAYVTCKVKGDPRPRVLWLRDMMPIDIRSNSRYSVSTLGNPGALMIQQAREDDQGKYECVARNEHGVVHSKAAHIYVKVRRVPPYFTLKLQKLYRVGIGTSLNLTCVAVGYPMPRVFWKRQSDDSYLNNPKTAPIGKNVLTLTNIENSENYTCIAVSDLGNIETSTTVEAKEILPPPRSFHVIETGDCNVRLKWDSVRAITEEDPVQSYVIKYRPKLDAVSSSTLKPISEYAERGGSFREVKVPPSQTTVTIEGLEPYQQYEFVLHAVSALGKGHPTMPIEVQTAETVPGNAPTDVKARPLNSQAVLVQWGPPEIPNGKITGYIVYYTNKALTDEQDKTDWLKKETKAEELMATLSGLEYEKTYYIQVQAKNTKGSGPFSKTVTVITKQGVPGQPSKLIAKPVDSRRISLTWEKPLHSYNIIGYTIRFNVSDTETKELRLTSDIQRHTVDGLRADTLYSFRVAAHSDRGQGAFGDAVTARTLQSVESSSFRPGWFLNFFYNLKNL
jgi:receptor-type tyrosine-protein phosphatase F